MICTEAYSIFIPSEYKYLSRQSSYVLVKYYAQQVQIFLVSPAHAHDVIFLAKRKRFRV
jgi:hypothetical protein